MFRIVLFFIGLCSIASLFYLNYELAIKAPDINPIFLSENKRVITSEKTLPEDSAYQEKDLMIDVASTYSRPLFNRERRKFIPKTIKPKTRTIVRVPKIKVSPVKEAARPNFTLSGVAIRPEGKSAFITNNDTGKSLWLKNGEKFNEWKLVSIIENSVKLEQQAKKITINLYNPMTNQLKKLKNELFPKP